MSGRAGEHEHQLVGLLLLLQDGRRNVIFLHRPGLAWRVWGSWGAEGVRLDEHPSPQRQRRRCGRALAKTRSRHACSESRRWKRIRQIDLLLVVVLGAVGHLDDGSESSVRTARQERGRQLGDWAG